MNIKILSIVGLVLIIFLCFLRRRERYEEPAPGLTTPGLPTPGLPTSGLAAATNEVNPVLDQLKTEITKCHGDSECIRKVMVKSVRSGYEKKIVAPVNEAS